MDLNGKVAVITGGGTGIGAAVAEALARKGAAAVVVNYSRSAEEARETVARLESMGCKATAMAADVSDDASVRRLAERVRADHGRVDALVCNAGTTRWVPFPDLEGLTDEVWQQIMGVNLMGAFYCARAFAPDLRAARGAIVNVASVAGLLGTGSSVAYGVSKAAMIQLTRGLAVALGPDVRVNAVAPGIVATRWHIDRVGEQVFHEMTAKEGARAPLRRTAEPEHIAQMVVALLESDMVTGEVLVGDGGRHLMY
ncbi:SDR family NAD(P)-dependent oxidoreductase [Nonomuraea jiangxiensis]|uniref:3-oxoacyl-[acyl-carrier protein] reductase n=1 Tax=Nonomuraea jiangxiensis TaxID=633440 RepID=A0A1G9V0F9_9ACTN|nr:SDR family oxidoreductase [Nonomuraea jiangxiensis]SDM65550.1 3-oxoacyl-[acyl-carrier protein] reductase [Nonomuraea jiangxiensis]